MCQKTVRIAGVFLLILQGVIARWQVTRNTQNVLERLNLTGKQKDQTGVLYVNFQKKWEYVENIRNQGNQYHHIGLAGMLA